MTGEERRQIIEAAKAALDILERMDGKRERALKRLVRTIMEVVK